MSRFDLDVAIIGSGPSGIAAATALLRAGINNIIVYEREAEIGGIPRHTHHPSFGLLVFKRPVSGPKFIRALVRRCSDVRFETSSTITALRPGGELEIVTASGMRTIRARHIIMATGARETPRHGRLVPGLRPQGITTTGALQQFIYSAGLRPFNRPVIVGTELVSFSALWTLRHAGITPVAMIEAGTRTTACRPATLFARLLRVPIHYNARISDIDGIETLKQVTLRSLKGKSSTISCDGVIFSGRFVGENTIAKASHLGLDRDNHIPQTDQNGLTTDAFVTAIGNAIHPADMGDQCYLEGLKAGANVARLLTRDSAATKSYVIIRHGAGVKMTTPSILRPDSTVETRFHMAFHVTAPFHGMIRVSQGDRVLYEKTRRCLPARRIMLRNIRVPLHDGETGTPIELTLVGMA